MLKKILLSAVATGALLFVLGLGLGYNIFPFIEGVYGTLNEGAFNFLRGATRNKTAGVGEFQILNNRTPTPPIPISPNITSNSTLASANITKTFWYLQGGCYKPEQ